MLKVVIIGVWVAIVTAGAAFVSAGYLSSISRSGPGDGNTDPGVEEIKTGMTSVPMVRGGEIIGYVIIQLSFAADRAKLQELKLDPSPYLVDAAFRSVYSSPQVDFRRLRGSDLDVLTDKIAQEANKRMGGELVRQVLIEQLNFVRREDIRTNWIGKQTTEH